MSKKYVYMTENGNVFYTSHPEYHTNAERMPQAAGKAAYREQVRKSLLEFVKPGTTVYTLIRHVSASGMQRQISCLVVDGGKLRDITNAVATVVDRSQGKTGGIVCNGCGMDMSFDLVYNLGYALFPDGFAPSNMAERPADGQMMNVDIGRGVKHSKAVPFSLDRPAVEALAAKGWKFAGGRNGDTSGWDNCGGYALKKENI